MPMVREDVDLSLAEVNRLYNAFDASPFYASKTPRHHPITKREEVGRYEFSWNDGAQNRKFMSYVDSSLTIYLGVIEHFPREIIDDIKTRLRENKLFEKVEGLEKMIRPKNQGGE